MLPAPGAQVRSLVRELDASCCNENQRVHVPQLRPGSQINTKKKSKKKNPTKKPTRRSEDRQRLINKNKRMAIKKGGLLEEKIPVDQYFQCCHYNHLGPGNSWLCPVSCIVKCLAVSLSPPPQDASSTFLSSSETQKRLQILPNILGGRGRHCTWLQSILIDTGKKGQID